VCHNRQTRRPQKDRSDSEGFWRLFVSLSLLNMSEWFNVNFVPLVESLDDVVFSTHENVDVQEEHNGVDNL